MRAVVALNPGEMVEAQSTLVSWVEAKLEAAQADLEQATAMRESLMTRAMVDSHAKRLQDSAAKRLRFYEKCKAALSRGYYIIPPFDLQIFAVRTDAKRPRANEGTARNPWSNEVASQALPAGLGRWVDPRPVREAIGTTNEGTPDKPRTVDVYRNVRFRDDVELPVIAQKPAIIEAVGKALDEKIFDALGIAPAYRDADPIIGGHIRRPDGGVMTFFVAWWLDEADLP